MVREMTCPRGHRFPLTEETVADEIRCPHCQAIFSGIGRHDVPEENSPKTAISAESPSIAKNSRGLWQLMSQSDAGEQSPASIPGKPALSAEGVEQPARMEPTTEMPAPEAKRPSPSEPESEPTAVEFEPTAAEHEVQPESTVVDQRKSSPSGADQSVPKGLWGLMPTHTTAASTPPVETPQRGLWSMMVGGAAVKTSQGAHEASPKINEQSRTHKIASSRLPSLPDGEIEPVELDTLPTSRSTATTTVENDDDLPVAPLDELKLNDAEEASAGFPPAESARKSQTGTKSTPPNTPSNAESVSATGVPISPVRSRGAKQSLLLGLIALPLSFLAFFPEVWMSIPATLLGFSSLLLGFLADGEVRRSRGRLRGRGIAGFGMVCGVAGMFSGPFVFSELGKQYRQNHGRTETAENLNAVGVALNSYRKANGGTFPPGSTRGLNNDQENVVLHNWTTLLLPYLGDSQRKIASAIDRNRPYDDPVNAAAMKRNIPMFFAAGADRSPLENGFAVTHFVAVGGDSLPLPNGRNADVGIFGSATGVRRRDITDGLKHTLIAGEISSSFPAWGKPEESRSLGNGLRGGPEGFGNSDRSGAMFLRADGSVKFLSRDTDPSILKRLSTRNGEEQLPPDY